MTNAKEQENATRIAEVVETASHRFVAECYELYQAPHLGALVRTGSPYTFAIVCGISTESFDPGRRIVARGNSEKLEEDIYKSNPQLTRLLSTQFEALIVGYEDEGIPLQRLPPLPPKVHAFVYSCTPEEITRFTDSIDFLHTLVASSLVGNVDEVIGACLRQMADLHKNSEEFLVKAGKHIAKELASDIPRLNAILRSLTR